MERNVCFEWDISTVSLLPTPTLREYHHASFVGRERSLDAVRCARCRAAWMAPRGHSINAEPAPAPDPAASRPQSVIKVFRGTGTGRVPRQPDPAN
ncbi:hypothetical protein [Frankia sp. QA3]|uniref:hypothetical protein n=1 Tax=Frankia sp. QA3 TaxID=710111 RepID=UPI000269CF42|nr:hypothetical protein [Frankia sp. QA3]EIV96319.1 hypothetical protein FraQA3DRAFT_6202 [Frankia sp. QA3]